MLNTSNIELSDAGKPSMPVTDGCPQEGVAITLPNGEVIVVDGVPHERWGYEPGKKYTVLEADEDGNVVWEKSWAIPRASRKL